MEAGPTHMYRAYGAISRVCGAAALALSAAACAGTPRPARLDAATGQADTKTIVHLLSRTTFGPRPGDIERVQAIGVGAYLDEQLHPERISDQDLQPRLVALTPLTISARTYAREFYAP